MVEALDRSELAARLGTNPLTLRRWRQGIRPNALHLLALLEVAASLDLTHPLLAPCRGIDGSEMGLIHKDTQKKRRYLRWFTQ